MERLKKHSENKWAVLGLLALAQFMVVLDMAIVNVALPSISRDLHFTASDLQWVVTAYTLTFGGFLLFGGRAADLFGRRKIFIGSIAAFTLASLGCGLVQSDLQLIIMRALQGLAAAIMSPAALSIVLTEFKEGKERHTALGVWAAVAAGGAAAGVLLGGVLTQYLGWRWNFFVNVPVGLLVVIASWAVLPHHKNEENKNIKLDLPGAASATAGLMALVYGLSKAPQLGWTSKTVTGFLAASLILLTIFRFNEFRSDHPLLPLKLFKIRNVTGGNIAALTIAASMFAMFFFLTLYVQNILGYSPVKAGLCFLPITFIVGITSAVVSRQVGKIGFKPTLVAGPLALSLGLLILSQVRVGGSYFRDVFPGLSMAALGMGLSFISMTLAATNGVPKALSGIASGVLNTSQQIGGSIGLAILSAVFASTVKSSALAQVGFAQAQVNGFHDALIVGSLIAATASLMAFIVVKNEKVDATKALAA